MLVPVIEISEFHCTASTGEICTSCTRIRYYLEEKLKYRIFRVFH